MQITVIYPCSDDPADMKRLDKVLYGQLFDVKYQTIHDMSALDGLQGQHLLFAVPLGKYGINSEYARLLLQLRSKPDLFEGCTSAIIIDGESEYFTKSTATELAFAINNAGSALIGRPLVEGTGSLVNYRIQAKVIGVDLKGAYMAAVRDLIVRLITLKPVSKKHPKLLVLHASNHRTSNTLQLWGKLSEKLSDAIEIRELCLRNGTISDCAGCPYTMCLHFGEKGRCFYGGVMQEEVWPAVMDCDGLMMLCPNYNDALSANLSAFINRLTGLFRQKRFYEKALFSIIVSGYSGGDIVARQVISALNMNKSFYLPAHFAMLETANDPGEALALPGIGDRLDQFALSIKKVLRG